MICIAKSYSPPPLCEKEILRYAACRTNDAAVQTLLQECVVHIQDVLQYKAVYAVLPLALNGDVCDMQVLQVSSKRLADHLQGCDHVAIMAATIGVETDRLIARYSRTAPSKAWMIQAIGCERVEALCDAVCEDIVQSTNRYAYTRFSPGYGDVPLEIQRDLVRLLNTPKHIGVSLTDHMLMTPCKSVTAFVGLSETQLPKTHDKCNACDRLDCVFRGAL